jgi:acetyl esterase/lipase
MLLYILFIALFSTTVKKQRTKKIETLVFAFESVGGAFVSSGAYVTNDQGKVDPKAQVYVNTYTSPSHVPSTSVNSRSGFGDSRSSVSTFPSSSNKNLNR